MKRHPSLAHLSREHHGALILARLLQKDAPAYKELPSDDEGKAAYALKFYREELVKHFEEEEKALKLVAGINDQLDFLITMIFTEHQELHLQFKSISNHSELKEHLHSIGRMLEAHVRKEERELFPLIQETCSEELMTAIDHTLSPNL
jgi:hemerythrin-like domain-containing protein